MTDFQFRLILMGFVGLVLWQAFYTSPKDKELDDLNRERKFGWLKQLSQFKRNTILLILLSVVASGLIGIAGMFFFFKWAAVVYLVATLTAKIGSYMYFKGGVDSTLEKTLRHSVSVGEALLFYLVFFGPAKGLFQ